MYRFLLLIPLLTAGVAPRLAAEILEAEDGTMNLSFEVKVPLSTTEAFRRFAGEVDAWWNSSHTYSAEAAHLSMSEDCFCERWGGNVVRHLEIVQYRPGVQLRLLGGLGPLQGLPLNGVMDVLFTAADSGTRVSLTYRVLGRGLAGFAGPVDGVIAEQIEGFRRHVSGE
jgi:hypothetical protein